MRSQLTLTLFVIIVIFNSCQKENDPISQQDLRPVKPSGKYLTEVWHYNESRSELDTFKYLSYEYDSKRYLISVKYYDPGNDASYFERVFKYNDDGNITSIAIRNMENVITQLETIDYNEEYTLYKEIRTLVSGELAFKSKTKIELDSLFRPIKKMTVNSEDMNFDSVQVIEEYKYDNSGNLKNYILDLGFDESESYYSYSYDTKTSAFYNTGFDYVHQLSNIPWRDFISYLPKHNMVEIYTPGFQTIFEIEYIDDLPVIERNWVWTYFYHYTDL